MWGRGAGAPSRLLGALGRLRLVAACLPRYVWQLQQRLQWSPTGSMDQRQVPHTHPAALSVCLCVLSRLLVAAAGASTHCAVRCGLHMRVTHTCPRAAAHRSQTLLVRFHAPALLIAGSECDGLGLSLEGLSRLTTLNTLALDRCTLNAVPWHVSHLTNLRVLSLHQSMQQGPDQPDNTMLGSFTALACLTALETLSISGCLLSEVPPAVLQLTSLKVGGPCAAGYVARQRRCSQQQLAGPMAIVVHSRDA